MSWPPLPGCPRCEANLPHDITAMTEADLDEHAAASAAQAPPLTPDQIKRLRAVFTGAAPARARSA